MAEDHDHPSLATQLTQLLATQTGATLYILFDISNHVDRVSTPLPASEEAIQALQDVAVAAADDQQQQQQLAECAICLNHDANGWKAMPCGHRFHGGCLQKWLRMHGTCPMCRHQMPTAPAPPADGEPPESRAILVVMVRAPTTTTAEINGNSETAEEEAAGRREPSDDPNTLFSPRAHLRRRRREDDDEPHRELRRRRDG
uniref:RING-type domain-containing protein n=1 Tax=Leersia perrieri TaxID=77586 RepID=A0A0D9VUL2_9ORYZ